MPQATMVKVSSIAQAKPGIRWKFEHVIVKCLPFCVADPARGSRSELPPYVHIRERGNSTVLFKPDKGVRAYSMTA